jgi:tetratricopeptide (TPR) repeat protein
MNSLKQLLHELHRRSLWQVLGIFLAASWGVLQVVQAVTESVGLPDWTPGMAFVLLLVGLPVVLATAFVQKGMPGSERTGASGQGGEAGSDDAAGTPSPDPTANLAPGTGSLDRPSTRPSTTRRLLTWRNAVLGGIGAFALLGFSLVAYFVMWQTGIGPVGNLEAQGIFEEGEAVVLADFDNSSSDGSLGRIVTEALRVDLGASQAISLVSTAEVGSTLRLMQQDPGTGLSAAIAREVAIREGVKAVIDGEVGSAGSGYIFTASIREAESGQPLATFRRTADSADDVIEAIDGLSQDIREKAGESLRSIKSGAALEGVTTSSLEALRLYAQAEATAERGDDVRAMEMLEQALELDPGFAMAWRKLSTIARSASPDPSLEARAATRAYELRDRLTPLERLYATAYYHSVVTGDVEATIRAYEAILEDYPDDSRSLNNISLAFSSRAHWEDAIEYLGLAIESPGAAATEYVNLTLAYAALGRRAEASAALAELEALRADADSDSDVFLLLGRWSAAVLNDDLERALGVAGRIQTVPEMPLRWRSVGAGLGAAARVLQGDWEEGLAGLESVQQRMLRDGAPEQVIGAAQRIALLHHYVLDDDTGAIARLGSVLDAGTLREASPGAVNYGNLIRDLVIIGDSGRARSVLDEWRSTGTAGSTGPADDWALAIEAIEFTDTNDRIAGFDRYRAQTRCDRCFGWEYAELLEEAGRPSEAADAYLEAMAATPFQGFAAFGHLIRVFGHERLGALYEELGDTAQAIEHYSAFADAFENPDAVLAPRVERAGARTTALGGGS